MAWNIILSIGPFIQVWLLEGVGVFFFDGGHLQPCGRVPYSLQVLPPGCLNNPVCSNLGLCAACWACFMCDQELWPTSASHPFPSLFIALWVLLDENITRKLLSLSLDLFFKVLLFQVTFLAFFSFAIFSPYFLPADLLLPYVALSQSSLQWQVNWMGALTFCVSFSFIFFLKLIVTCRLWVISAREEKQFQWIGYHCKAFMDCMDLAVRFPRKAIKFEHSLTPSKCGWACSWPNGHVDMKQ